MMFQSLTNPSFLNILLDTTPIQRSFLTLALIFNTFLINQLQGYPIFVFSTNFLIIPSFSTFKLSTIFQPNTCNFTYFLMHDYSFTIFNRSFVLVESCWSNTRSAMSPIYLWLWIWPLTFSDRNVAWLRGLGSHIQFSMAVHLCVMSNEVSRVISWYGTRWYLALVNLWPWTTTLTLVTWPESGMQHI